MKSVHDEQMEAIRKAVQRATVELDDGQPYGAFLELMNAAGLAAGLSQGTQFAAGMDAAKSIYDRHRPSLVEELA